MEMKLIEQLHRWRRKFLEQGSDPAFVPLTREELTVVVSDCPPYARTECFFVDASSKLFGIDVFESPFAEEMRGRQIDVPVLRLEERESVSYWHEHIVSDYADKMRINRRMVANVCGDTTKLTLTFEWDSLAKFKRKFRLTKWFPVRTRTVTIEGRVLYPYLKVTLPHNKHHVQFNHTQ